MYDGPNEDLFVATTIDGIWFGSDFFQRVKWYEEIHAYSDNFDGPWDYAKMYDGPNDDTFTADSLSGALSGTRFNGDPYFVQAHTFDAVHAFCWAGGYDVAHLYDSIRDDTYYGSPTEGAMWDDIDSYWIRAKYFEEVNGHAGSGGYDQALLHDSALVDLLEADDNWAQLSSTAAGYAHWVADFAYVKAHGSSNPGDTEEVADILFTLDIEGFWE